MKEIHGISENNSPDRNSSSLFLKLKIQKTGHIRRDNNKYSALPYTMDRLFITLNKALTKTQSKTYAKAFRYHSK